jgi:hypothetical protein
METIKCDKCGKDMQSVAVAPQTPKKKFVCDCGHAVTIIKMVNVIGFNLTDNGYKWILDTGQVVSTDELIKLTLKNKQ